MIKQPVGWIEYKFKLPTLNLYPFCWDRMEMHLWSMFVYWCNSRLSFKKSAYLDYYWRRWINSCRSNICSQRRWSSLLRSSCGAMNIKYCVKLKSSRSVVRVKCARLNGRIFRPFNGLRRKFRETSSNMIVFFAEYSVGYFSQITGKGLTSWRPNSVV